MTLTKTLTRDPRVTDRNGLAPNQEGDCVVYWMQRSQRARNNLALNVAIEAANELAKPVVVFFALRSDAHHANHRHYQFMLDGLGGLADGLRERNVGFVLRRSPEQSVLRFCREVNPCLLIGDEDPQRNAEKRRARVARELKAPFWTVDSDVIVPTRLLGKEHFAARTIRPKLHQRLDEFLKPVRNVKAQIAWKKGARVRSLPVDRKLLEGLAVDRSVTPVSTLTGGPIVAQAVLRRFLSERLPGYSKNRNQPQLDGTSQLSPYLHFGQIGPHEIALAVKQAAVPAEDRKAFLEELIVRRELAINFVRYNAHYESWDSSEPWADRSLRQHAQDERRYLYSERQIENAESHDPLWNAAQKQMVLTGWMHGYVRMYWAKKILEWTPSAAQAFDVAVRLNDRYELDGRDPNGYAGIAWAIVGKHDRAWGPERPAYGKIRYMSYESTSRKFNSKAYIERIAAIEKGELR
ncbi:MAG TPA: deoxyribodipyrimidine photo-lyase [Candidatus Binatia bacterium]|nr:deoxyribodipyrimidine photo-lyase [Candidatus Binatia bacterium]